MSENARMELRLSASLRARAERLAHSRAQSLAVWVRGVLLEAVEALEAEAIRKDREEHARSLGA